MSKIIFFISLIVLFLSSCSSSKKIAALKPEPDDASPLVYDNSPSFVSLPIVIKLKDVENQINKALNGLIYEDNNIEDDNLTVKIWKQAYCIRKQPRRKDKNHFSFKSSYTVSLWYQ